MKKVLAMLLAVMMVFALSATAFANDAVSEEDMGFTEIPIFEDEECEFMNVSAVYFQPVPMSGGYEDIEGYDMHLEADIHGLENAADYGFEFGGWIPYLTVDFEILNEAGEIVAEGTFMPMSADDGPHYGANIKLAEAGTYTLRFLIHNPGENGYLVHLDKGETGPAENFEDLFANGPLVATGTWDYFPQEW